MDAQRMFLEQYDMTAWVIEDLVLAGLTDEQIRTTPSPGQNSVAWLLWHSARWEDIWTNTWVAGCPQVLDSGKWLDQLNLERREAGTGWMAEDCAEFNGRVDVDGQRAYVQSLRASTRGLAGSLAASELGVVVDEATLREAAPDGAVANERAPWLDGLFANRTKAWYLAAVNMHNAEHSVGEALCVRSQAGFALGL